MTVTGPSVLVSWVGSADLRGLADSLPPAARDRVVREANLRPAPSQEGGGPIRALLAARSFDHVHLLSNYPAWITKEFCKQLNVGAEAHLVSVKDVIDYGEIYSSVDETLKHITKSLPARYDLWMFLSPGTPAMAAVWVLLGKSKYPARFLQTYRSEVKDTHIPFDLAVDVVPELLRESDTLLSQLSAQASGEVGGFETIIGSSAAIRLAISRARKAALRDVSVLLLGESGTGKEVFARSIHAASSRRSGPFVVLNCAAIPSELIESELFGHVKGAFTGADKGRDGAFKQAHKGVLFLDEVGELAPRVQAKLLRVLQPLPGAGPCVREVQPVGASQAERVDVRVVAATHRDLVADAGQGLFREDLYYRLAAITVKLPPLRERKTDVPLLAKAFLDNVNRDFRDQEPGYRDKSISDAAISFVRRYGWPGNVRQLSNVILQAAVMADGDVLNRRDFEAVITQSGSARWAEDPLEVPLGEGFTIASHLEGIQRHYLERAMREAGGNKTRAASLLGIENYQTLDAQLKRLKVDWERS